MFRSKKSLIFAPEDLIIKCVVSRGRKNAVREKNRYYFMKKKIGKMNEAAWVLAILICTLGVVLCIKADFGVSMIAAPAVILQKWLSGFLPWVTNGMCEYAVQGIVLMIMCVAVWRFRPRFLLSFATAVICGFSIDMWVWIFGGNGAYEELWMRIVAFVLGELTTAIGIAFFFRTTLPIQTYELFVCEIADKFKLDKNKVKMAFDISFFVISAAMSLLLTGGFNGFGIGTVIITLVNAPLIALFGKLLDKLFEFDSLFSFSDKL